MQFVAATIAKWYATWDDFLKPPNNDVAGFSITFKTCSMLVQQNVVSKVACVPFYMIMVLKTGSGNITFKELTLYLGTKTILLMF